MRKILDCDPSCNYVLVVIRVSPLYNYAVYYSNQNFVSYIGDARAFYSVEELREYIGLNRLVILDDLYIIAVTTYAEDMYAQASKQFPLEDVIAKYQYEEAELAKEEAKYDR